MGSIRSAVAPDEYFIVGVLFLNVFGSLGGVGTFAIFLALAFVSAAFVW